MGLDFPHVFDAFLGEGFGTRFVVEDLNGDPSLVVDVVESLSARPKGDIDDQTETRRQIGPDIVTRAGINCELMYDSGLDALL